MNINVPNIILFIGLFLLTLASYSVYLVSLGFLFVCIFFVITNIPIAAKPRWESFVFSLLLLIAVLRFHILLINEVSPLFVESFYGNASRYILCIGVWMTIRSIAIYDPIDYIKKLIAPLLAIHVSFFYAQFLTFLSTGYYLDFYKAITGKNSRYISVGALSNIVPLRSTGMLVEPSTYFFVILTLSTLLILKKEVKQNKILLTFSVVSMYLTFSTAAFFIATIFVLYLLFLQKPKFKYIVQTAILILPLIYWGSPFLNKVYKGQMERTSGQTGDIRMNLVNYVIHRDPHNAVTDFGIFASSNELAELTRAKTGNREMSSMQDAGLFIYMWAKLGFLGIIYFFILSFVQYKAGTRNLWLFIILSLTKIHLFSPLFVFYFAFSISKHSDKHKYYMSYISLKYKKNLNLS